MTATAALLSFARDGWSAPQGGSVVSGSATINQSGTTTNVNQSTNKAIINWQSFSVGSSETVNFNQPSTSSVTLNRVTGNEKSVIDGALNANGQVFLINSAGVLVGKGASVNTAGFAASTRDISNDDFNAGKYVFQSSTGATGDVINLGTITVTPGGYVVLLGKTVSNQGVIAATRGTVALASGDKVTLNFNGDSLLSITVDQGTLDALVENKQAIYADGGLVFLTAKAAEGLLTAQVNNDGLIQARTIDDVTGNITLLASNGTTTVGGTLDASAPNGGNGGFIETSGDTVNVLNGAKVTTLAANGKTGTWLIDPNDFTIAASGGNMTAAQVVAALGATNFQITTATMGTSGGKGDINVNQAVTWNADTTLTLTADRNVNVNKAITANGNNAGLTMTAGTDINVNAPITLAGTNAALTMTYGNAYNLRTKASYSGVTYDAKGNPIAMTDTSGGVYGSITFTSCNDTASCSNTKLRINGADYTLIGSLSQLDALDGVDATTNTGTATAVTGNYALAKNLSADASTTYVTSLIQEFGGSVASTLAGLGHTVDGVKIASAESNVGLIGQTGLDTTHTGDNTVVLRDIGITNFNLTNSVSGSGYGALLGSSNSQYLRVSGAYSTGSITAGSQAGGLIGSTYDWGYSTISDSYSSVNVKSTASGGGLIGYAGGSNSLFSLTPLNPVAWRVTNQIYTYGFNTTVTNSHATGTVTANTALSPTSSNLGGLAGQFSGHGKVSGSYATGDVEAHSTTDGITDYAASNIGGLIGYMGAGSLVFANSVTNSFATGDVIGGYYVGGLIGYSEGGTCTTATILCGLTASNIYAKGNVTATSSSNASQHYVGAGGLIGSASNITLTNAHASGNVTQSLTEGYQATQPTSISQGIGGLIGNAGGTSTVSDSSASGNVTTGGYVRGVGGLVGSGGTITNSSASGNVTTGDWASGVGGLAGSGGAISGSTASGNITTGNRATDVGGLVGNAGTITNSSARGNVTVGNNASYVGGLAGRSGTITNSSARGNITTGLAATRVGGLVGQGLGDIIGSSASGDVDTPDDSQYVGGIAGQNSGTISNSHYTGNVSGGNYVGGIVGKGKNVENSSVTGTVKGKTNVGNIAGSASGTVTNNTFHDPVIEQREEEDARQRMAAIRTAAALTTESGDSTKGQGKPATSDTSAMTTAPSSLESQVSMDDDSSYDADIRSIDVNGEHFDLTNDGDENKPKAQR